MHVESILRQKGRAVETVRGDATVGEIALRLAERAIGAVVVVSEKGEIAGIVSERDIVRCIGRHGAEALAWPAAEMMSHPVVTCRETDSIDDLMRLMTERRFRHLPVAEHGRLAGIVSIGDVVKHRVAEVETEAMAMRDYITAG